MDARELFAWFWLLGFWEFSTMLIPERLRIRVGTTGAIICGFGFAHAIGLWTVDSLACLKWWYLIPIAVLVSSASLVQHRVKEDQLVGQLRYLAAPSRDGLSFSNWPRSIATRNRQRFARRQAIEATVREAKTGCAARNEQCVSPGEGAGHHARLVIT
jgi:hypothetical protein